MNALIPFALPLATLSTSQAVFVAIASGITLVCALAVAFSNRAVHAAVYMMGMMISLAGIYFSVGAEFLGAVQIVVYTGAIMMMFLFVIMLVGVQAVDSPRDSKKVTVFASILMVLAFAILAILAAVKTTKGQVLIDEVATSNPVDIATSLINTYYFPMELVACLLVIAAVGAMTLTHSDQLLPRLTQRFIVTQRMKAYKERGLMLGQQVPPGVYAETNALDVPAINGETSRPEISSVPRVIRVRGEERSLGEASPWTARTLADQVSGGVGLHGKSATLSVKRSGAWGMPGSPAAQLPTGLTESSLPEIPAVESDSAAENAKTEEKGDNA